MNRINKVTLREKHAKPKPIVNSENPVYMTIKKEGYSLSMGLFSRLGCPRWIEFFQDGEKLFIAASDEEKGFKVTYDPVYATTAQFRNRYLGEIFGELKGRLRIGTDPITRTFDQANIIKMYEIILPKK